MQSVEVTIIDDIRVIRGLTKYRHPVGVTLHGQGPSRKPNNGTWSLIYTLFDKGKDARKAEAENGDWTFNTQPFSTWYNVICGV